MPLRLINPKTVPKDGYTYIEPSTGRPLGGMFSFNYVVQEIVGYRKGNGLPRDNKADASEDLDRFTCNRDPRLCYDSELRVAAQVREVRGCGSCGIVTT